MAFMKSQKWSARDTKKCIVIPSDLDHKYSRGTLGVITGSAQYPGAAVLTTRAAIATGLGVLRFHSSSGLAHLVLHSTPKLWYNLEKLMHGLPVQESVRKNIATTRLGCATAGLS